MRNELKKINGERRSFSALLERYGVKGGYISDEPTILLKDVTDCDTGKLVCDHLWLNLTKQFKELGVLPTNTELTFDARVASYTKGYKGRDWEKAFLNPIEIDYTLTHPSKVKYKLSDPKKPVTEFFDMNAKNYELCNQIREMLKVEDEDYPACSTEL